MNCDQHIPAEELLRESLAIREKTEPDAWTTFNTHSLLGGALLGQKKYTDAEPLLLKGYEGLKAREKTIPQDGGGELGIPEALDRLIELYTATNKPDEVKKYQELRAKYPRLKEVAPCAEGKELTPAELLPLVYDELRRLAAAKLAAERPGHTLDATALVHEAWLKLADVSIEWQSRSHFFRTAATAMRRILVDRARAKSTARRDSGQRIALQDIAAPLPNPDLLALDEALNKLATIKPDHAKLAELRFFAGMSGDEAAETLGVSPATADRMWRYTKAWLKVELSTIGPD